MPPSILTRLACSLFALPTIAAAVSLSGRMVTTGSTPEGVEGVNVTLAGSSLSARTDGQGVWSLGEPVGVVAKIRTAPPATSSHLQVSQGRLQVVLGDRDVLGRTGSPWPSGQRGATVSARTSAAAPDTLVYSFDGKVFLRDTLTTLSQTGIVRVFDTTINPAITYGYFTDVRDGQTYRTVTLGSQIWMAQNLNFAGTNGTTGVCPNAWGTSTPGSADFCAKYGRLYAWAEVMNGSASTTTGKVRGICPVGWHVPTDPEWTTLVNAVESESRVGTGKGGAALKSTSGWADNGNGTDLVGFTVLPAGFRYYDGKFITLGSTASFWSASELDATYALYRYFSSGNAYVNHYSNNYKSNGFSLRCSQD